MVGRQFDLSFSDTVRLMEKDAADAGKISYCNNPHSSFDKSGKGPGALNITPLSDCLATVLPDGDSWQCRCHAIHYNERIP